MTMPGGRVMSDAGAFSFIDMICMFIYRVFIVYAKRLHSVSCKRVRTDAPNHTLGAYRHDLQAC